MYRRLLTAASSQPGRHPQGHTIDVKLRPTFDQSSPLHAAVKQALGSKTDSALELPRELNRHFGVDFILLKSGNMSNYGLGCYPQPPPRSVSLLGLTALHSVNKSRCGRSSANKVLSRHSPDTMLVQPNVSTSPTSQPAHYLRFPRE